MRYVIGAVVGGAIGYAVDRYVWTVPIGARSAPVSSKDGKVTLPGTLNYPTHNIAVACAGAALGLLAAKVL